MPRTPKLQRWTDLLAALLRRQYPAAFETLQKDVPAYAAHANKPGATASLMRKFERDKDELRAFGVPIETRVAEDGNLSEYQLTSKSFYLPYLVLANQVAEPRRPRGLGYKALPTLAFEPDELAAIVRGGRRVQSLGDPALAREAANALRKIAHDLPIDDAASANEVIVNQDALDAKLFDALASAIRRRKSVTFSYHSMGRDARSARHVDPYGIAYISGNWYLVARDRDADALRQFRVARISALEPNAKASQTPDFDVPESFDLWDHTRSRQAWELGDVEAVTVTVQFTGSGGHVAAAMKLGTPVAGDAAVRGFRVRRIDSFLRWILGFAGAARPVDPAEVVREYNALVRATLSIYDVRDDGGAR